MSSSHLVDEQESQKMNGELHVARMTGDMSNEARTERKAARRQYRRRATIATLAMSVVLYLILLLRPDELQEQAAATAGGSFPDQSLARGLDEQQQQHHHHHHHQPSRILSEEGSHHHFVQAASNHDFSSYSCEDMHQLTAAHGPLAKSTQCDFARTCNDDDGIFAPIVFCHPTLSTRTLMLLLGPPLVLFLLVLFRILGSTAEEFFSPGLEMFSLKLGLPERFAGVTLLALGNGAPDVASTVNAILDDRKRGYLMALGELTGAAMVASTVIVGAVTYVAGGVQCRGALIRDVLVFMLTMAVTYKSFEDGTITVAEIRCFIGVYVGYVLVVLGCDLHHKFIAVPAKLARRRRRKQGGEKDGSDATEAEGSLDIEMEPGETTALVPASDGGRAAASKGAVEYEGEVEEVTPVTVPEGGIEHGLHKHLRPNAKPIESLHRMIEAMSYYDVESNEISSSSSSSSSEKEEEEKEEKVKFGGEERTQNNIESVFAMPSGVPKAQQQQVHKHNGKQLLHKTSSSGWGEPDETGSEPLMVFHPHHGGLVNLKHARSFDHHLHHQQRPPSPSGSTATFATACQECIEGMEPGHAPESWREAFVKGREEVICHVHKLWDETYGSDDYNVVEKFLITCEMPFTVLRMLSIPVPCDGYYCRPLVALSIALSPLWMWYYCWNQFGISLVHGGSAGSVALVLVVPLIVALLVLRYAPCGEVPMRSSVAVPITVIGFAVSAAWLDLIADKLVSLLSFFGIMLRIPSTIMGITILAWGNSSQDMIANMTVAKKGLSAMAITASFAGPVFNILVGLGIGLTILSQTGEPGQPIPVYLNNPLRVGFLFAVLNGVLVIVSGVCVGKGTIPKYYGYVAMALYGVYAVTSLTV